MAKINSFEDLKKHKDAIVAKIDSSKINIRVAMATCSLAAGSKDTMGGLMDALKEEKIDAVVTQTGCMGACYAEPTVEVIMPGKEAVVFGDVDAAKAKEIVKNFIKNGSSVSGAIKHEYTKID